MILISRIATDVINYKANNEMEKKLKIKENHNKITTLTANREMKNKEKIALKG